MSLIWIVCGAGRGVGKTTLALQMMVDLAASGSKILYITLEQSPGWLKETVINRIIPFRRQRESESVKRKSADWKKQLKDISKGLNKEDEIERSEHLINENLFIDSSVPNMDALPDFLIRKMFL